jgi:hypothetical protein
MKGIVFTEFLEMVEESFSPEVADRIIEEADLPSGGAYTAVGTYDSQEMFLLVANLSRVTGVAIPDLLKTFGRHLFGRFYVGYPHFFEGVPSALAFLKNIEDVIHVEVRKLYPDAELPRFECEADEPGRLVLVYRSQRRLADLAEGLMMGCADHYKVNLDIRRENVSKDGEAVRFELIEV